jgi:signal transduction histidine kinase
VRDVDQIVFNLILNAADALGHEGEIFVATEIVTLDEAATGRLDLDLDPGRYLIISVRDNGAGMDSETRARAFEPFYSTKPIGKGFGLGLSTVEATVQEAKGAAIIQSEPGAGSFVTLYLPVVPAR